MRMIGLMNELTTESLAFHSRLLLAVHGLPDHDLRTPERTGAWSILGVIGHLGDLELVTAHRLRMMLVEDSPTLPSFDQNAWVAWLHADDTLAQVAEDFWSLRRANVRLLRSLSEAQLDRTGIHPEFGVMTIRDIATRVRRHDERHLAQIERIKASLGLQVTERVHLDGIIATRANGTFRSPSPGIRLHDLWSDGTRRALQVEIDAGVSWQTLDHHVPGPEEVYVVSGDFKDGLHSFEAGTFIHHPAGSSHIPASEGGCVLFVFHGEG